MSVYVYNYPRPMVTVDAVVFTDQDRDRRIGAALPLKERFTVLNGPDRFMASADVQVFLDNARDRFAADLSKNTPISLNTFCTACVPECLPNTNSWVRPTSAGLNA